MKTFHLAACLLAFSATAAAAEPMRYALPDETATLRSGPGVEAAQDHCMSCHSADYVNAQPPKKGRAFWESEVSKMVKTYHAPIEEADAKAIVDYLEKAY